MKNEIAELIRAGLYEDNLRKLIRLCKSNLSEAPALYGTLILVFESLANEYDNQAISVHRYNLILNTLQEPLIILLEETNDPPAFIKRLDAVFECFAKLKGY